MKCSNCGSIINEGSSFCQNCGSPVNLNANGVEQEVNPMASEAVENVNPVKAVPEVAAVPTPEVAPESVTPVVAETPVIEETPVVVDTPVESVTPSIQTSEVSGPSNLEEQPVEVAPAQTAVSSFTENVPVSNTETTPLTGEPAAPMTNEPIPAPIGGETAAPAPEPAAPKKKSSVGIIIAAVLGGLALLGILVAVFMVGVFGSVKKAIVDNANNINNNVIDNVDNDKDDDTDKSTTTDNKTYSVNFKGYTFTIPAEFQYTLEDDRLILETATEAAGIEMVDIDYDVLIIATSNLMSQGYSVANIKTETFGVTEYKTVELTKDNTQRIFAYTKASNSQSFGVEVINSANTFDYDLLTTLSNIFATAEYTGLTDNANNSNKDNSNNTFENILESFSN